MFFQGLFKTVSNLLATLVLLKKIQTVGNVLSGG